jgi:ubiquinone/menaquinone biosynthesis C-methylase UbiE
MSRNAERWDSYWTRKKDIETVYSNEGRIVENLEKVTGLSGKYVLEVGAGTGRDSADLAKRGAFVVVLDNSSSAIAVMLNVREKQRTDFFPVVGDVRWLPFAPESFHIVFHQGLLEHFEEPGDVLGENRRVLARGGYLLVDVPQKYHPYTAVKHVLMRLGKWFAGWETEYTIGGLRDTLSRAGFRDIVHCYGAWMYPSFFYRSLRELLLGMGVRLPMYPSLSPVTRNARALLRRGLAKLPLSFATYHTIGIIAKK